MAFRIKSGSELQFDHKPTFLCGLNIEIYNPKSKKKTDPL